MNIRLLWHDNDPKRTLEDKVRRAALHYLRKYGQKPTLVYLSAKQAAKSPAELAGLKVLPSGSVLENHFFLYETGPACVCVQAEV